jgi:hypothetical protein
MFTHYLPRQRSRRFSAIIAGLATLVLAALLAGAFSGSGSQARGTDGLIATMALMATDSVAHTAGCNSTPNLSARPSQTCQDAFYSQSGQRPPFMRLTAPDGKVGLYRVFSYGFVSQVAPVPMTPQRVRCQVKDRRPYLEVANYAYVTRCTVALYVTPGGRRLMVLVTRTGHAKWFGFVRIYSTVGAKPIPWA